MNHPHTVSTFSNFYTVKCDVLKVEAAFFLLIDPLILHCWNMKSGKFLQQITTCSYSLETPGFFAIGSKLYTKLKIVPQFNLWLAWWWCSMVIQWFQDSTSIACDALAIFAEESCTWNFLFLPTLKVLFLICFPVSICKGKNEGAWIGVGLILRKLLLQTKRFISKLVC